MNLIELTAKAAWWLYDGVTMYDPLESAINCLEDAAHIATGDGLGKSLDLASGDVGRAKQVLSAAGVDCWAGDRRANGQGHLAVKEGDLGKALAALRRNGISVR